MQATTSARSETRGRRVWIHPLPGGAEGYKRTLDAVLAWIDRERPDAAALGPALGQRHAAQACLSLIEATGLACRRHAALELTDAGRVYAADPDPERLFERLHAAYVGLLEALVLADTWGIEGPAQRRRLLDALVERGSRAPIAGALRLRWLASLGLLERVGTAHTVTLLGRQVLGAHTVEATEIRKRIEDLLEQEREADLAFADAMEDQLPDGEAVELPRARDRVALTAEQVRPHLAHLDLPDALIERCVAALSSGKHLLLLGPPGTGKTDLARGLGAAAAAAGYCRGMSTVTASADWTTYETIGGYALERDGSLGFRPGVFLTALAEERWLLVDELNRADVDRAFGELLTVLAGHGTSTPYRLADGRAVSVGAEPGVSHRVPPSFRLVATMNTWDRAALFRLSHALLRRFAVVSVGPPDDAGYARLLDRHAQDASADPPLDPGSRAALGRLFRASGLLAHCPVGPAIALDMIRYARRRAVPGVGLAEAAAMVLLPQLEGLPAEGAAAVSRILDAEIGRAATPSARGELRARLRELFPEAYLDDQVSAAAPWEAFLAEHFPGFLLPDTYRRALPDDVAARFLARIGGGPRQLFLLKAASVVAAWSEAVRELALTRLPDLVQRLPRRTEPERRAHHGELRGRLDAPATLQRRLTGRLTELVARAPRVRRHPPEDVLLGAVTARLLRILRELRAAGVMGRAGWGAPLVPCEAALALALAGNLLTQASSEPITARHEEAARVAPHPAYPLALALHRALRRGLDARDPELVARVVAEGALAPLADHTRFELAVLMRLIQALAGRPGWTLRRTLVLPGRREVAVLDGAGGARVRLFYDQACLEPGPYDAGLRHYLGQHGRLRPDVTLVASAPGRAARATVIEAKLSTDPGYLAQGLREAMVYRAEYGDALTGWPKAILVTSGPIAAPPRREDDVIAVGWDQWVPAEVTDGLLDG